MTVPIKKTILSESLRMYCSLHRLTTRQLAKTWSCSHGTVSRFLNGEGVEMQTFIRILDWAARELPGARQ